MIRTLLVDDENLICQALQTYLALDRNIEVVGTANSGEKAIAKVKELIPDVVLLDIEMPDANGITTTKRIRASFPDVKVIIFSSYDSSEYFHAALDAGAKGYLLKNTSAEELCQSIELVDKGYSQFAPGLIEKLSLVESEVKSRLAQQTGNKIELNKHTAIKDISVATIECQTHTRLSYDYHSLPQNAELSVIEADDFLPSISSWTKFGAIALLGIFGTTLLLSNVLKYKTTVKSDVKVRPAGELRVVQAATQGTVTEIKAEANQAVKRGEIIAVVDSSQLQTTESQQQQKIEQIEASLSQTKAQIANIDEQIAAEKTAIEIDMKAELTVANTGVQLAEEEILRLQQLQDTGAISQLQIAQKQATLQTAIAERNRVRAKINSSQNGQSAIIVLDRERQTIIERQITLRKELAKEQAQLRQIKQQIESATIRASESGIINELNLRNHQQIVDLGETIATITPADSTYSIVANIEPQDIGSIEAAQLAQIKISACPYPDYGILAGVVDTVSPDAVRAGSSNSNIDSYQVKILPEDNYVGTAKHNCKLKSGMTGSVNIITNKETVFNFLMRKARLSMGV